MIWWYKQLTRGGKVTILEAALIAAVFTVLVALACGQPDPLDPFARAKGPVAALKPSKVKPTGAAKPGPRIEAPKPVAAKPEAVVKAWDRPYLYCPASLVPDGAKTVIEFHLRGEPGDTVWQACTKWAAAEEKNTQGLPRGERWVKVAAIPKDGLLVLHDLGASVAPGKGMLYSVFAVERADGKWRVVESPDYPESWLGKGKAVAVDLRRVK
jgi:hypothetical protein